MKIFSATSSTGPLPLCFVLQPPLWQPLALFLPLGQRGKPRETEKREKLATPLVPRNEEGDRDTEIERERERERRGTSAPLRAHGSRSDRFSSRVLSSFPASPRPSATLCSPVFPCVPPPRILERLAATTTTTTTTIRQHCYRRGAARRGGLVPPLIDSCAISRHSCQINNARRWRRWRRPPWLLLRHGSGADTEMRNPLAERAPASPPLLSGLPFSSGTTALRTPTLILLLLLLFVFLLGLFLERGLLLPGVLWQPVHHFPPGDAMPRSRTTACQKDGTLAASPASLHPWLPLLDLVARTLLLTRSLALACLDSPTLSPTSFSSRSLCFSLFLSVCLSVCLSV
nr:uncharacterized protein LOC117226910 [Megalopta genalis]XP_033337578.1 uncharacterized protein LOC117226910 [Megalopta genalis]